LLLLSVWAKDEVITLKEENKKKIIAMNIVIDADMTTN
jgi:hypothetical protein